MGSTFEIARAFVKARWPRVRKSAVGAGPIETAREFEANFADRNALGVTLEAARKEAAHELAGGAPHYSGYSFGLSSGTLGAPGVFITSERERDRWIGAVLGKFLPFRLFAGASIALILKYNNRLYTDVHKTRRLRLHYFNAAAPVADWAGALCAASPDVLIGPPSVLEQLAMQRRVKPSLLIAGAEPLFPQDAARLRDAFGVMPRVIYQAKEGFLAAGCAFGQVHLNEDLIHFERMEIGGGRFVPVITDLTRTSQRYRRFRLDDVLIAAGAPCACGSPLAGLTAIEGRANDVLLAGDRVITPHAVNDALQHADNYTVTQTAPDQVLVAGDVSVEALSALVHPACVSVAPYEAPRPGEKRRRVRRLFDPHNDWLSRFTVSRNVAAGV
jgi:putative adenylate-forming enzyme